MNLKEIFNHKKVIEPEELKEKLSKKEALRQIKANNKIQIKKNKANEKSKFVSVIGGLISLQNGFLLA